MVSAPLAWQGFVTRSRWAALLLALGLFGGAACADFTGVGGGCFHSEGCDDNGGGLGGGNYVPSLNFTGLVTSAQSGQALAGVAVRVDAPARGWTGTAITDSAGHYVTDGLSYPMADDCVGLSVSFSREGFQPLHVVDLPQLSCAPGFAELNGALVPIL
jgi:hypothetical protein